MRGALVVLEGIEGAGKSTQVRHLARNLVEAGGDAIVVREPGGTPVGDAIRALLLDPAVVLHPSTEALLFMASRAQLVRDVIRPALASGRWVITDRFFLSTYAYQVAGRGLDETEVRRANMLATGGLVPDLTLLLDLPLAEGMRRVAARGGHDRMEQSGESFHQRVAAAFEGYGTPEWQAAHPECGPIVRVEAGGTEDEVAGRIRAAVSAALGRTFAPVAGSHS